MSARRHASVTAMLVTGALALGVAGCASQGVIGAASGGPNQGKNVSGTGSPSAPGSSAGPADPSAVTGTALSSSAPPSSKPSSSPKSSASSANPSDAKELAESLKKLNELWTDPGCKLGLHGFGNYLTAAQQSAAKGNAAIPGAITDLKAGARATKRQAAAQAMTNMAKDLQAMADAAKAGKPQDKGPLKNDWSIMGNACTG